MSHRNTETEQTQGRHISPNSTATPTKRKITTLTSHTEDDTPRTQDMDTHIASTVKHAKKTLEMTKTPNAQWHAVIWSTDILSQNLIDEAIAKYCKDVIIAKAKLTQSKHSIFYRFDNIALLPPPILHHPTIFYFISIIFQIFFSFKFYFRSSGPSFSRCNNHYLMGISALAHS